MDQLIGTQ